MVVCGVDEVGRGPLAGDTYAAAVILPPSFDLPGLNDSKKLSAKKRETLCPLIRAQAVAYSIASATVGEIEALGIVEAVFTAMRRAVSALQVTPGKVLVDGKFTTDFNGLPVSALIGGDGLEPCIMAASILAKVARDQYMVEMDTLYPGYAFSKNKGYGVAEHRAQIRARGLCPIHRKSFCRNMI